MDSYLHLPLDPEQFWRLNFEEGVKDHWYDVDFYVRIYKLDNGTYQQYIQDENGNKIHIGVPIQTVGELMEKYNSISGLNLIYWDRDYP